MRSRGLEWLPSVLAAVAFVGCAVVFGWLLVQFWADIGAWARRDLRSQAELAAESLREPLRTQDFRKLAEFHQTLEKEGLILRVRSARGGWIFHGGYKGASIEEYVPCDDFRVGVAIPESRIYEPFYEALLGFVLAVLVGVLGMVAVFLVLYRQRVRIRELARLERFRREFIADVSHEIKTPLSGILGAVDLLGEESKSEVEVEQRRVLLSLIRKESKRLNGLVQSILDLARLEREGDALNLAEVDLGGLVRETAAKYPCVCEVKSSCVVRCDAQLVEQAISNLIGNAVRHSGSDEILVTVACDGRTARIAVEDHGVGIPREHAERIFERFHRVDPARAAETGGAGLGLAIVRRIARLHRGDVAFSPVSPRGSRFTLFFPAAAKPLGVKK